jgi:hypothetical protein
MGIEANAAAAGLFRRPLHIIRAGRCSNGRDRIERPKASLTRDGGLVCVVVHLCERRRSDGDRKDNGEDCLAYYNFSILLKTETFALGRICLGTRVRSWEIAPIICSFWTAYVREAEFPALE